MVDQFKPVEPAAEKSDEAKRESRCLVLFAHGGGIVLTWMAGIDMAEFVQASGGGSEGEPFALNDVPCWTEDGKAPDGLYVGEFRIVDDGPESWEMPHIRDYVLGVTKLRPATAVEWNAHRRGDWPWDPLEGSRFYEDQAAEIEARRKEG